MSDSVAPHDNSMDTSAPGQPVEKPVSSPGKGKGKAVQDSNAMEEDEEEEDDDEEGEEAEDVEEEDDDDDMEEDKPQYLPRASRRTRAQVDYASAEALQKAGLTKKDVDEDEEDEDFQAKPVEEED